MALSVAPEIQLNHPHRKPVLSPNASSTQATPPLAHWNADPSSAVTKASGTLNTNGAIINPRIAAKFPPERELHMNKDHIIVRQVLIL